MVQPVIGTLRAGRRAFLRWVAALGGGLVALLAGVPALRAFLSPGVRRAAAATWIKVGEADLFEPDVPTKVDFVETVTDAWVENRILRSVWVYTDDGENFTVYSGRCTHLGCSYGFDKDKGLFRCPCHEGVFSLKTGEVLAGPPPRSLDRLETKMQDGILFAAYRDFRVGVPERIPV